MLNLKLIFFQLIFCLSLIFFFNYCQAAVLYLEPEKGEYQINDTFIVDIKIDAEKECVNTIEAILKFSPEFLKIIDFSQGNSFLVIWLQSPKINQEEGTVSFIGGVPGGYCGKLSGDPGENNLLGKIIIQAEKIGETSINFSNNSQVLLNDGQGTPVNLTTKQAIFTILPGKLEELKNEWQENLATDKTPPELFKAEINQDTEIFEGKYFITFNATDKQTGIDYYEVKEGKRSWKKAESPYLLEDQSLKSIIEIKAVDKAGNERLFQITPEIKTLQKQSPYEIIALILLLIVVVIILWLAKKNKK